MGIVTFPRPPSSEKIIHVLGKIVSNTGKTPKYIISDKGSQFHPPKNAKYPQKHPYRKWCRKHGILPRYGAVGKYGSIAVIERFIKSLKYEYTKLIIVPFNTKDMRYELALFMNWYNLHRPHEYLKSRTPQEMYEQKLLKR